MKSHVVLTGMVMSLLMQMEAFAAQERPSIQTGMAQVAEPVLYYEVAGRGPAVVLIHGGQMDCRMWDEQFTKYAQDFRVIRYDVRAFGRSEMPIRPYSDVKDLLSLLDFLHVSKAHLVGLSLGGRIAVDFTLEHPERVASLVLVGPGLSGFPWSAEEEKEFRQMLRAFQEGKTDQAVELWLRSGYMAPAMANGRIAGRLRQLCTDNAKNWLANPFFDMEPEPPAFGRLGEIRVPTLVMVGSRDVPDIQKIVKKLKDNVPNSRLVVIEGAGHIVNMEKPEEFDRAVFGFLKEQPGRAD